MKISKTSPISGKTHIMDLPITEEQISLFLNGAMVQDAFPNLSPKEREFILSGITPEEWDRIFPEDDE